MELKTVFSAYGEKPFLFIWGSVLYVFFSLLVLFATTGILLFSSLALFFAGFPLSFEDYTTITLYAIPLLAAVFFLIYMNGCITAATIYAYKKALTGSHVSLVEFYHYGLSRGPMIFSIGIMRDFFMLIIIGIGVALYYYALQDWEYGIHLLALYSLSVFFVFHLTAKPGIIACGLGAEPFEAFKELYFVFAEKHIYYVSFFFIYSIIWLLNFIPLIQFVSLPVLYPLVYSALITMVEEERK